MKGVFLIILFCYSSLGMAQNEDKNWTLPDNVLLNFTDNLPLVITNISELDNFGISCISDKSGNLLFYGDCGKIFNKQNEIIYSAPNDFISRYHSVIIPKPNSGNVYYIFNHLVKPEALGTSALFRILLITIEIDNNNLAQFVSSQVLEEEYGRSIPFIVPARHQNNVDFWLLTSNNLNLVKSYHVTENGVILEKVSDLGQNINVGTFSSQKLSPDFQKIMYSRGLDTLSVMDFDCSTGAVSNLKNIVHGYFYSNFEFSPGGDKIFITSKDNDTLLIKQYPVNLIDKPEEFLNSGKIIYRDKLALTSVSDIQIGHDQKIYLCLQGYSYLGVIENPDLEPPACHFLVDGIYLNGETSGKSFPHFMRYHASFSYKMVCNVVNFTFHGFLSNTVLWDFGDGQTSNLPNPVHFYLSNGNYKVKLTVIYNGHQQTISRQVSVTGKPSSFTISHN